MSSPFPKYIPEFSCSWKSTSTTPFLSMIPSPKLKMIFPEQESRDLESSLLSGHLFLTISRVRDPWPRTSTAGVRLRSTHLGLQEWLQLSDGMKSCPVAGCGEVTGIETGRDPSPKFSMFQSSCASFCFLGVYFLLALALIKRACWGGGCAGSSSWWCWGLWDEGWTALDAFAFLMVCTFPWKLGNREVSSRDEKKFHASVLFLNQGGMDDALEMVKYYGLAIINSYCVIMVVRPALVGTKVDIQGRWSDNHLEKAELLTIRHCSMTFEFVL